MMKKFFLIMWLFALLGCARNPVTGKREIVLVSESQEISMGRESHPQVQAEYGFVDSPAAQAYIEGIGKKIAAVSHRPNLEWHFTVVNSPVVNAFAIPGGYVYFTRGILAYLNDEAEVAGVMGHEETHVTARHSVQQVTRTQLAQIGLGVGSVLSPTFGQFSNLANSALGLMFLRFSRDNEREADRVGVEYASKAGYDPREISNFFDVLSRLSSASDRETIPGWLSTHPDPGERVMTTRALAEEWIKNLNLTPQQMTVNRDGHLRAIDGLVFGNDPREGFLEGQRFYHPVLEFQITFPPNWKIENTNTAVYALDPQQNAQMQLTEADAPDGTSAQDYVRLLASRGLAPESGENTTINGNRAFLGVYRIPVEGGTIPALAAFIEYRQNLYQIIGAANNLNTYGERIEESIRSFDRVTEQRILSAKPDRVLIYTAKQGETLQSIAMQFNNPRAEADELGILNRLSVTQPLAAGRLVKVVTRGY
jgi:predicted Zn-dependent protease